MRLKKNLQKNTLAFNGGWNLKNHQFNGFLNLTLSLWIIKFPYFMDTTKKGVRGERRPQNKVKTRWIYIFLYYVHHFILQVPKPFVDKLIILNFNLRVWKVFCCLSFLGMFLTSSSESSLSLLVHDAFDIVHVVVISSQNFDIQKRC